MKIELVCLLAAENGLALSERQSSLKKIAALLGNGPTQTMVIQDWLDTANIDEDVKEDVNEELEASLIIDEATVAPVFSGSTDSSLSSARPAGFLKKLLRSGKNKPIPEAEKFNDYGCYCSPNGKKNGEGGEPVDEIDTLCKDLYQSYQCLRIDYGDCTPGIDYDWKINKNGEPTCADSKGTCKGDVCRLDMAYTRILVSLDSLWNPNFHRLNGFDRQKDCQPSQKNQKSSPPKIGPPKFVESVEKQIENGSDKFLAGHQCCGTGLVRHPFLSATTECCLDGSSKPLGSC